MSEQKPVRPGPMQQNVPGPAALGNKPGPAALGDKEPGKGGPEDKPVQPFRYDPARIKPTMRSALQPRTDPQARRGRGRLSRETLNKLGKVLEAYFDDVRSQGVPDRFKELLQEYDDRKEDQRRDSAREDHEGSS
jgi:Anti-sigma factor NepR